MRSPLQGAASGLRSCHFFTFLVTSDITPGLTGWLQHIKISAQLHVTEAQERHDKSPKKWQLIKPDAAPRRDSTNGQAKVDFLRKYYMYGMAKTPRFSSCVSFSQASNSRPLCLGPTPQHLKPISGSTVDTEFAHLHKQVVSSVWFGRAKM